MKKTMRLGWLVVLVAGTLTTAAGAQTSATVKDDLFNGTEVFAKGASNVTEITMDPDTLDLVGGTEGKRAHNMVLNVVRTYTYDKPGMYRIEDVDAIRNKLNSGDWHCSVHTRDMKRGESTDICSKRRTDGLVERAIITVEPKELTFIHTIRKGGGQSELGELPMMMGLPFDSSLAMLDPQQFIDMKMAMTGINGIDMGSLRAQMATSMKNAPKIDSAEMQEKINEAMKQLKEAQKNLKLEPKSDSMTPQGNPQKEPE